MMPSHVTNGETNKGEVQERATVRVLFFGAAREIVVGDEVEFVVTAPSTTASVRKDVLERFPRLARFGRSLLVAVKSEYAAEEVPVRGGDEVAFFPPVSGGSGEDGHPAPVDADFFELTREPIDVGAVARRVLPPECGATVTFDGYVRAITDGRRTEHLVYEAYETMALGEMRRLGAEARERFEVYSVAIVHRTGELQPGETSVRIAVAAPHRRAAFAACEWLIAELKRRVPVWKREVGAGGATWVEGECTLPTPTGVG